MSLIYKDGVQAQKFNEIESNKLSGYRIRIFDERLGLIVMGLHVDAL